MKHLTVLSRVASTRRVSGVARICCEEGQSWKLCHGALTAYFRAGCSSDLMTDSFVTNVALIERVRVVDISWQTSHTWIVGSQI